MNIKTCCNRCSKEDRGYNLGEDLALKMDTSLVQDRSRSEGADPHRALEPSRASEGRRSSPSGSHTDTHLQVLCNNCLNLLYGRDVSTTVYSNASTQPCCSSHNVHGRC